MPGVIEHPVAPSHQAAAQPSHSHETTSQTSEARPHTSASDEHHTQQAPRKSASHDAANGGPVEPQARRNDNDFHGSQSMSEEHIASGAQSPHHAHSDHAHSDSLPAPEFAPVIPVAHLPLPVLSPDDREADERAARRAGQIVENIIQSQQGHRGAFIPTQVKTPFPGQGGGRNDRKGRDRDRGRGRDRDNRGRDNKGQGQGQAPGQGHGKDRDRNRGGVPPVAGQPNAGPFPPKQNFNQPRRDRDSGRRQQQGNNQGQARPAHVAPLQGHASPVQGHAPQATHSMPETPSVAQPVVTMPDHATGTHIEQHSMPRVDTRPIHSHVAAPVHIPIESSVVPTHAAPMISEAVASAVELSSFDSGADVKHLEPIVSHEIPSQAEHSVRSAPDETELEVGDSNYAESMGDESAGIYEETAPTADYLVPVDAPLDAVLDVPPSTLSEDEAIIDVPSDAPAQAVAAKQNGQGNPRQKSSRNWRESTYESSTVSPQIAPSTVRKVVLLNSTEPGEIRVAILENGELAEIFMERKSHHQQAGNIYKGRVVNVEPSLQAAFIDLGAERNGFLHASDVIPPNGGYPDVLDKKVPEKGRQRPLDGPREPRENRDNRENRESRNNRDQRERGATPPSVIAVQQSGTSAPFVAPTGAVSTASGPLLLNRPARPSHQQQRGYVPPNEHAPLTNAPAQHSVAPASAVDQYSDDEEDDDFDEAMPVVPGQPFPTSNESQDGVPGLAPGLMPGQPGYQADFQNRDSKRRRRRRGGRGRANRARVPGPIPMLAPVVKTEPLQDVVAETPNVDAPVSDASSALVAEPVATPLVDTPAIETTNHIETPVHAPVVAVEPVAEVAHPVVESQPVVQPVVAETPPTVTHTEHETTKTQTITETVSEHQSAAQHVAIDVPTPIEAAPAVQEPTLIESIVAPSNTEIETEQNTDAAGPSCGCIESCDAPVETPPVTVETIEARSDATPESPDARDIATDRMDRAAALADLSEYDVEPVSDVSEDGSTTPTRTLGAVEDDSDEDEDEELDPDAPETVSVNELATRSLEPIVPGDANASGGEAKRPPSQHRKGGGRKDRAFDRRYTIQEMLREGQEVLVQVAKEGIGQKGPALTTYISLPGRYLVLMPAVSRLGVSKRIDSEEQRRALKEALAQLNPPDEMGVIVRTAGMGRSKDELQRDLDYLMRAWNGLKDKTKSSKTPNLIYQEGDVVTRVFRDVLTEDVTEIIIDDPVVMERAKEFLRETSPGSEKKLKLYSDSEPLFHRHGVEQQMQRLFNRKVNLKSGGSIVIEQTEALVAIDVNTGRFREKRNQDDTILQTNLEAAREIARQLRLRDIGGLVMIDFIDMEISEHKRKVERELKAYLARDKAKINVLPVSSLGVVEMTRQRIRHSLKKTLFDRCPHCSGSGHIKSPESIGLEMLREIKSQVRDKLVRKVKVLLNSHVAYGILNQFRKELVRMEEANGITIEVCGDPGVALSQMQVSIAKEGGDWVLKKVSEVDDYVRNS